MRILGIDPGIRGAFALAEKSGVVMCEVMPESTEEIISLIQNWEPTHVYIEKAQAMPKQGVSSVFSYGTGFGILIGIVKTLKLPMRLVPSREWTKSIHLGTSSGTAKERSKEAALNLFPNINFLASPRSKKLHDGLIDACCLAEFARRELK